VLLAFVLTLEDPSRFAKSRQVGACLELVPATDQSGGSDPEKRISKHGDKMMRKLLVGSAHYILGPFGEDSDLRHHGEKIAGRGGKNAKKRAVVAVARKLSVLLHRYMGYGGGLRTALQCQLRWGPSCLRALCATNTDNTDDR
jgi:transposase